MTFEENKDKKVIVIGSGVFGISSAYNLAKKGYTNIEVFDKNDFHINDFSPLAENSNAASADFNKLIRSSYVDKIRYQNLATDGLKELYEWNAEFFKADFTALKGYESLHKIQQQYFDSGKLDPLFKNTGYVRLDDHDNGEETRNLANFEEAGLRDFSYDINNPKDVERSKITGWYSKLDPLGQREKVPTLAGVLDSFAGVALANRCMLFVKFLCEKSGSVKFTYGSPEGEVAEIIYSDSKTVSGVKTKDGKIHGCDFLVIGAGGWSPWLAPQSLSPRLESVASTYVILKIPDDRKDLLLKYQNIPQINYRMTYESNFREDGVYVFPATEDGYLKLGVNDHFWRHLAVDENSSTTLSVPKDDYADLPKKSVEDYKKFISTFMPDLVEAKSEIVKYKLCFTAQSLKNEFLVDFVRTQSKDDYYTNLIICSGGGFHGFKFLPNVGKFVEGLISGVDYEYHDFFKFKYLSEQEEANGDIVTDINHEHALNTVAFPSGDNTYVL